MDENRSRTRRSVRILALSVALLSSISCLVGPNYHPPQAEVPPSWTGEAPSATGAAAVERQPTPAPAAEADLAHWWRRLGDEELSSLIGEALQTNYDLQSAEARLRQSRALRGVVAGALWPQVNASAGYTRSHSGEASAGAASRSGDFFQAGFDAVWEIDVFGGLRRNLESAGADVLASQENIHDVQVSLVSEVALIYVELRGAQQRSVIARKNLEDQQRTAEITRKRQSVGFVSALDVANAEAQAATTLSQIPALEKSARVSINALSVLLARPPADLLGELSEVRSLPVPPAEVAAGSPPDLLRRRPDIRQAEALLRAATAQVGVAAAELFPKVSVSGSLSWQSDLVRDWFSEINRSWTAGAGATWSLFSGGSRVAAVRAQEAARDQALINYRQTILAALQDVENALVALAKDRDRRQALTAAAAASRRATELASELYIQGATEFINVLEAERSLYASEDALVQSEIDLATDVIILYKSLGGGWEPAPEKARE